MDDKFLYQNRPPVRPGFSENLYARLSNMVLQKKASNKAFKLILRLGLAGLLLFTVLFTFSEPVRASVLDWIRHIAGFNVTDSIPDPGSNPEEYFYTPQPFPSTVKDLPFAFSMPAYVPDDFAFSNDVVIAQSKSWVAMSWSSGEGEFDLLVQQDWEMTIPAGVESTKEVKVNEQPAILIQGGWDENGKWDNMIRHIQLYWRKDGLIYILSSDTLSDEELIKIAESID